MSSCDAAGYGKAEAGSACLICSKWFENVFKILWQDTAAVIGYFCADVSSLMNIFCCGYIQIDFMGSMFAEQHSVSGIAQQIQKYLPELYSVAVKIREMVRNPGYKFNVGVCD